MSLQNTHNDRIISHLRNWSILIKLFVHRCSFSIFSSICHADSENVIKNSVSAWTSEAVQYGTWLKNPPISSNFGQKGLPELADISGVQADTEFLITFSESA